MAIRQPIVVVVGHVDHGKTTLLDSIRGTSVADREAGKITQHIAATEVPIDIILARCGAQLKKMNIDLTIPGLLFIDTPGHEAFTNLRKRGGSLADIAVLVVDINQGIQPQTKEAVEILKSYKTPFIIAANKIDLLYGWQPTDGASFSETFSKQYDNVKADLDKRVYEMIGAFYRDFGISCERFDRVDDFTKQIVIVPLSGKTKEGLSDLLLFVSGLTQKYMEQKLQADVTGPAKGTVLEVNEVKGLGMAIDVIIYDGVLKKGDTIIVGGRDQPVVTNVKSLWRPNIFEKDPRKKLVSVDMVTASAGVRVTAPDLDSVVPGASIRVANENQAAIYQEFLMEMESLTVRTDKNGIIIKTDTLGSLEALVNLLSNEGIPIRRAEVGTVGKKDISEANAVLAEDPYFGVIFAFNTPISKDVEEMARDSGVSIFYSNVIYKLIEDYTVWKQAEAKKGREDLLKAVVYPAKFRILPGFVFHNSRPAIVGVEVLVGNLKTQTQLINSKGERVGKVKEIQHENKPVHEASAGKQVAVSIEGLTIGKGADEGDTLYANVPLMRMDALKAAGVEPALLDEIAEIKRSKPEEE